MRSEAEIRRAFYLLGAVLQLSEDGSITPLPELQLKNVKGAHSVFAWTLGGNASGFSAFLDSLESQFAAEDMQIVQCEGGARILPLRDNHREKRTPIRKR